MALALSLSLDLFLMKGSLFIADREAARDRQTERGRRDGQRQTDRVERERQHIPGGGGG